MTDMVTIGKWTIDLDDFDYSDFFVGKEKKTVVVDGKLTEHDRYIYDHDSYYKARGLADAKERREHKDRLREEFAKRGIVKAEIEFSGGNDDGGPDGRTFYDADGKKLDIDVHYRYTTRRVGSEWREVELSSAEKEDNRFLKTVDAPINWRWGSFAGEFSVHGTLQYDLTNDEEYCKLEYNESTYEYHEESF